MAHTRLFSTAPTHRDLIRLAQQLGYQSNNGGICYGIACMGAQAILVGDIDSFNNRLSKEVVDALLTAQPVPQDTLTDMRGFFDGVEVHFQSHLYPELFENHRQPSHQEFLTTLPLTAPTALREPIEKIASFTGLYTAEHDEIYHYFDSFQTVALERAQATQPIVFILNHSTHAITVGFDPVKQEWLLIDANQLPTQALSTTRAIADAIMSAFSSNDNLIFSSELFATHSQATPWTHCLERWKASDAWQQMHTPTRKKALAIDSKNATWLLIAAKNGDQSCIQALLSLGAQAHHGITDDATPLYLVETQGHLEITQQLVNGLDDNMLNHRNSHGATALYIAAQNGHFDIVKALVDARANCNIIHSNGSTPLYIAAQNGYTEIVRYLVENGAEFDNVDPQFLPVFIAAQNGHTEIVSFLLENDVDPNTTNHAGASLLFTAAEMGHSEIVALLIQKKANPYFDHKNVKPSQMARHNGYHGIADSLEAYEAQFKQYKRR